MAVSLAIQQLLPRKLVSTDASAARANNERFTSFTFFLGIDFAGVVVLMVLKWFSSL